MIKTILLLLHFILLTLLTQIGGLVYLLSIFIKNKWFKGKKRLLVFPILYLLFTFILTPLIAPAFGRTALPYLSDIGMKPHNMATVILNRHYVTNEFKSFLDTESIVFHIQTQQSIYYLDANFPFFDGFPLLPHLSHSDGKKIDLAFIYNNDNIRQVKNPSFLGYGNCVTPRQNELNMPEICDKKGHWQYSILEQLTPNQEDYHIALNYPQTKNMIEHFATSPQINKLFLEPHLKKRMKLTSKKIRFHGCHAVRHDDHIHVEFK